VKLPGGTRRDARLRVADPRGQQALGQLGQLVRRSPEQVEWAVRSALENRGGVRQQLQGKGV
jgi:hypothetical protein